MFTRKEITEILTEEKFEDYLRKHNLLERISPQNYSCEDCPLAAYLKDATDGFTFLVHSKTCILEKEDDTVEKYPLPEWAVDFVYYLDEIFYGKEIRAIDALSMLSGVVD